MVYGNSGGTSGSGVAFTRDPATGENALYMDFLFNAQGDDVVSGGHEVGDQAQIGALLPEVTQQIEALRQRLEAEFGDLQEFEFTVQNAQLYMLQTRNGKRTPLAALRIAVEMVAQGRSSRTPHSSGCRPTSCWPYIPSRFAPKTGRRRWPVPFPQASALRWARSRSTRTRRGGAPQPEKR